LFSVQEYTKRPRATSSSISAESVSSQRYHPRHIVHPSNLSLQECLEISDVIISAVPSQTYRVKTEWLKDGCVCLNVAAEKNFEKDVRDKVRACVLPKSRLISSPGIHLHPVCR
jgi:methylenetetrahydrofolate dehydrogenase (NAD+)